MHTHTQRYTHTHTYTHLHSPDSGEEHSQFELGNLDSRGLGRGGESLGDDSDRDSDFDSDSESLEI
jgi:hypothetical protein